MKYVIGIDFGSDSVRALLVNASTGQEVATSVHDYSRWSDQLYCDPDIDQFRQHPLDYIEGMTAAIIDCVKDTNQEVIDQIIGVSIDTTGSTPVAVNKAGIPLALTSGFEENPHAMFVLWKDHTAVSEAADINALCQRWQIDYTKYEGGIYSSEWFWAKILKVSREDEEVRKAAYTWVEHCDWIPFLLTGGTDVKAIKVSRCAAGHKAMWHEQWGGLPSNDFFKTLDVKLDGLVDRMYQETYTSDVPVGHLSEEWAEKLGLSTDVVIGVGAFDAHMGAVGAEIAPYHLCKIMGTSTCDVLVAPLQEKEHLIRGICGQVDGSVIPGMLGMEAGQSAFGDIYAWYANLILGPLQTLISESHLLDDKTKSNLIEEASSKILQQLSDAADQEPIGSTDILSLDWINGRRTPDANQHLSGLISGLKMGSNSAKVFRSLVESSCYGARIIIERFISEGVPIHGVIALGGVAKKSPFIMQMMADVINRPIKVAKSEQACALGAAMFAATVSGIYNNVSEAMQIMGSGFDTEYHPITEHAKLYEIQYQKYLQLAGQMESFIMQNVHTTS